MATKGLTKLAYSLGIQSLVKLYNSMSTTFHVWSIKRSMKAMNVELVIQRNGNAKFGHPRL
jgi:hypothetical protein